MTDFYAEWTGYCNKCLATITVSPHPDQAELFPDLEEWAEPIKCPVCWGNVQWERDELFGENDD